MNIDQTTHRSPNYSGRYGFPVSAIVVHSCEGHLPSPRVSSIPWLCNPASEVSAHYYLCRDATIYQLVDDSRTAWHAGICVDAFRNERSLGIELEHRSGAQDWPQLQEAALAWLLGRLVAAHGIAPDHIETHGQIALPGPYDRKKDPGDWPHIAFRAWVAALFVPAVFPTLFKANKAAVVWQTPEMVGGQWGHLQPGELVHVGTERYPGGAIHLLDGRGFVRLSDLDEVA